MKIKSFKAIKFYRNPYEYLYTQRKNPYESFSEKFLFRKIHFLSIDDFKAIENNYNKSIQVFSLPSTSILFGEASTVNLNKQVQLRRKSNAVKYISEIMSLLKKESNFSKFNLHSISLENISETVTKSIFRIFFPGVLWDSNFSTLIRTFHAGVFCYYPFYHQRRFLKAARAKEDLLTYIASNHLRDNFKEADSTMNYKDKSKHYQGTLLMIWAIYDQCVGLVANALFALSHHLSPEQAKLMAKDSKLLRSFLLETLRLYPPLIFSFPCKAIEGIVLDNFSIKKNDILIKNLIGTHQNPEAFANPRQFKLDRFLHSEHSLNFVPGGYGPHQCPGIELGILFVSKILNDFLNRYESIHFVNPHKENMLGIPRTTIPADSYFRVQYKQS